MKSHQTNSVPNKQVSKPERYSPTKLDTKNKLKKTEQTAMKQISSSDTVKTQI